MEQQRLPQAGGFHHAPVAGNRSQSRELAGIGQGFDIGRTRGRVPREAFHQPPRAGVAEDGKGCVDEWQEDGATREVEPVAP